LMFVGEGILIGVLSMLLALPLSIPGTILFSDVLGDVIFGNSLSIRITPLGAVVWFLIVMAVSTSASVAPANRASQISIREAISYE
ncbi:MAG: FtsX-like permease family protein, partial [Chloroflexota bacterium]